VRKPPSPTGGELQILKVLWEHGPCSVKEVHRHLTRSAAAAAGLKPHDILLEFAGKPVPADGPAFVKMVQEVKPGTPVEATVLRKGRKETIKGLTLPEGKNARATR
jgi:S1-C subfamily serine protease